MTNEEAIKYLIPPVATSTEPSAEYLKQKEAYELAIKALEERSLKETTFDDYLKEQLKDPEFRKEWEKLCDEEKEEGGKE